MVRQVSVPNEWGRLYESPSMERVDRYEATRDKEPTARVKGARRKKLKVKKQPKEVKESVPPPQTGVVGGFSLLKKRIV